MFTPNRSAHHARAAAASASQQHSPALLDVNFDAAAAQSQINQLTAAVQHLIDRDNARAAVPTQAASSNGDLAAALAAAVTAASRPPLEAQLRFSGTTDTLAFDDWVEQLAVNHDYYARSDVARQSTTVALLGGNALKAHLEQTKLLGAPASYTELIARLAKTWRLQEPFYALHAKLMALCTRGPGLKTDAFAREYSVLAGRIDDAQMNQHMKVHHFVLGLRPSLRPPVMDKKFASLPLAVAFVLQRDATRSVAGAAEAMSSSGTAEGATPMDIDVNSVALANMSAEDRAACLRALSAEGLREHDTSASSSSSSGSHSASVSAASAAAPAHTLTAVDVAAIVAAQLAAVGLGSRGKSGSDKGRGKPPPARKEREVPEPLAKARMAHGLCVKCGVVPFTPGRDGHNSNTCKAAADKLRWPQGMTEQDKQVFQ